MGFDDLARHMAARDKKKLGRENASADEIVADMAKADRRMDRTRNLVLGPILLLGGLIIGTLYVLYILDATDTRPHPNRPPESTFLYWNGALVFAGGMLIVGARQLYRGLRGR
jgi:hypothetical protein